LISDDLNGEVGPSQRLRATPGIDRWLRVRELDLRSLSVGTAASEVMHGLNGPGFGLAVPDGAPSHESRWVGEQDHRLTVSTRTPRVLRVHMPPCGLTWLDSGGRSKQCRGTLSPKATRLVLARCV